MKKVYGYARISRDEDKKNYGSIETQKSLIMDFAKQNDWKVEHIYVDDDVSGFIPIENRPAFNELYKLVNNSKEKPIVLMKDWSRLSRNNGIAQTILTNWKRDEVELILIKEMGSPFNILTDNDDIVGITTWINERYVKETSRKVRDALKDRLQKGIYISGPRYGYIKGENGTLTVNEEVREAVQTIFNLYEQGIGMNAITRKLNIEYDFKNPSIVEAERFKRERGRNIKRNVREYWETDMVKKILKDETYTGTLVTHKKEVKGIHGKAKVLPKEEHYRFENHHEAIISEEQFDRVQNIIKERVELTSNYKKGKNDYIFGGFVRCGECNASASGEKSHNKLRYNCLNHRRYGDLRCINRSILESYILQNFKLFLKDLKVQYMDILKEIKLDNMKEISKNNDEKMKLKLDKVRQEYKIMQLQKIKELANAETEDEKTIIDETYSEIIKTKLKEITDINEAIQRKENKTDSIKRKELKQAMDYFDEIIKSNKPSKELLSKVLDKIIIYKDKSLEFKLKINIEELI